MENGEGVREVAMRLDTQGACTKTETGRMRKIDVARPETQDEVYLYLLIEVLNGVGEEPVVTGNEMKQRGSN